MILWAVQEPVDLSTLFHQPAPVGEPVAWFIVAWFLVVVGWFVLLLVNVAVGIGPTADARGSRWRLVWVSGCLAALAVLPLGVAAAGATWRPESVEPLLSAGLVWLLITAFTTHRYLKAVRFRHDQRQALPLVTDPVFLARIAELSAKMKLAPPLTRLWPSGSGSPATMAFMGTLQAPQLTVTDGLLQRLSPTERDAIVAHELGHLANHSLWLYAAMTPLLAVTHVQLMSVTSSWLGVAIAWTFYIGVFRIVSRRLEYDCDLRAARAIGFRETVAALAKVHAMHSISNTGRLSLLVYATASHPSRDARLAVLCAKAPPDDGPQVEISATTVAARHRMSLVALLIWLASLGLGLFTALRPSSPPAELLVFLWLSLISIAPYTLLVLAQWSQLRLNARRMKGTTGRLPMVILAISVWFPILAFFTRDPTTIQLSTILAVVGCLVSLLWNNSLRLLQTQVITALSTLNFPQVITLARNNPRRFAAKTGDAKLRYNLALARAGMGDFHQASADLEALWQERPQFLLAPLLLCNLYLDGDHHERALELATAAGQKAPSDPAFELLRSRALRGLGKTAEAQAACDRAAELVTDGNILALSALLACDQGDEVSARSLIQRAEEAAPGEGFMLAARAELALRLDSLESAQAAVESVKTVKKANPFLFLNSELAHLDRLLTARLPAPEVPMEVVEFLPTTDALA